MIASIILSACEQGHHPDTTATPQQDSLVPPLFTVLAELPDSSWPKTIYLDSVPAPLTIAVPTREGGSYTVETYKGPMTHQLMPPKVDIHVDSLTHLPIPPDAQGTAAFTNFNSDMGLVLDNIRCCVMDKSGTLWFGSDGSGISRYDGKRFTTITTEHGLADGTVRCAIQDRNGLLWFGTGHGVSRYDGRTFTNYSQAPGLDASVSSILEDRTGNLWFGTPGQGVTRYDGKAFTTYTTKDGLANDIVWSIIEDRTGKIWFGTGKGLSRFDPSVPDPGPNAPDSSGRGRFTTFTTADGLMGDVIYCLMEDASGYIWIGGVGGLSRFDGKTFTNFTKGKELHTRTVRCLYQDPAGTIWIGGDKSGLTRYNPSTALGTGSGSFATFTTEEGLSNDNIRSITPDRSGSLWLGTVGGGVSRYDGPAFTNSKYFTWGVHQDTTGALWFGGSFGLARYDMASTTWYGASQGLATENVLTLVQDDSGHFWCGSFGTGLARFDGERFTTYTTKQGLAGDLVWSSLKDRDGNLWFGTHGDGISRFDGKGFTNYTNAQGLAGKAVNDMLQDRSGVFWFATDEGVSRFDGERFTTLTIAQGLTSNGTAGLAEDGAGNLWITTAGGVSMLSAAKAQELAAYVEGRAPFTALLFENYSTKDGLPGNDFSRVLIDGKDRIYLSGVFGLCELVRDTNAAEAARWKVGRSFTTRNGYPVKEPHYDQQSLVKDRSGIIWIATNSAKSKLVRFDPAALHTSPTPELAITGIKVGQGRVVWNDLVRSTDTIAVDSNTTAPHVTEEAFAFGRTLSAGERDTMQQRFSGVSFSGITPWHYLPEGFVLPYAHNSISFDVNAIETVRNQMVNYRYILEGYDKDWSPPTQETSVTFGNIREGNYTFKVKAQNPEGAWGDEVTYTFTVLPPWYRTWWMYVIYGVVALLLIRGYVMWRERKLKQEKVILEGKIEMATEIIRKEKDRSEALLLNILPQEVAEELKAKGSAEAVHIDQVTVLFTDFKGFTAMSETLSPQDLVRDLNECFSAFDHITEKYGIEKIKTIGDAYMAAGGLPTPNTTHATDVINAALEMAATIAEGKAQKIEAGLPYFEIRIGVHTGPVVAGIVGVKKFSYDIWGDTVNTASRMESSGEVGQVNISEATYELVKNEPGLTFTPRGKVQAKGKGKMEMYFVERA